MLIQCSTGRPLHQNNPLSLLTTIAWSTNHNSTSTSWKPGVAEHLRPTTGSRISLCPNAFAIAWRSSHLSPQPHSCPQWLGTLGMIVAGIISHSRDTGVGGPGWASWLPVCILFCHYVPSQYHHSLLLLSFLPWKCWLLIVLSDPPLISSLSHISPFHSFTTSHVFKLEYIHAEYQLSPSWSQPVCPIATKSSLAPRRILKIFLVIILRVLGTCLEIPTGIS